MAMTPDEMRSAVADAMREYDLTESAAWSDLDALATNVKIDHIEVDPAGILLKDDGTFEGVYDVYLVLEYGKLADGGFSTSESFSGRFFGHSVEGTPIIDSASVDTSRFYM